MFIHSKRRVMKRFGAIRNLSQYRGSWQIIMSLEVVLKGDEPHIGKRGELLLLICKIRNVHNFHYRKFPTEAFYNH